MSNFLLFVFGLGITLISGMGVLVYMASLGYKQKTKLETLISNEAISEMRTVSKPGAALEVPPNIQNKMAQAILEN